MAQLSSRDLGYETGDLSVYPEAIDNTDTLFEARNNAETTLKNGLSYTARYIVVHDTSSFPSRGILRVGREAGEPRSPELIHYGSKTGTVFSDLTRGYSGSRQNQWPIGSYVANAVHSEHHNAPKDAILNVEANLGISDTDLVPATDENGPLNGILKELETRFLSPKPFFRCTYLKGVPPLTCRFQNFTEGDAIRFLWDFGDGTTSDERNPTHTYIQEGLYTVKLDVIVSTGGTGVTTKYDYVNVNEENSLPFFYVLPRTGVSVETALARTAAGVPTSPTNFEFVDQTDGDIVERYWVFGDGEKETITDPNVHSTTHVYTSPGTYEPSLLTVFASQDLKRVFLEEEIVIT